MKLVVPYPGLITYKNEYSFWKEFLFKPENSIFIELDTLELYKHWNGQVILDFKWNTFGFNYYIAIWIINIMLIMCFATATTAKLPDDSRNSLLVTVIVLALFHLSFEIRRLIWNPVKYIKDFWNYFGKIFFPVDDTRNQIYQLNLQLFNNLFHQ